MFIELIFPWQKQNLNKKPILEIRIIKQKEVFSKHAACKKMSELRDKSWEEEWR